jgi:hypothetical protein
MTLQNLRTNRKGSFTQNLILRDPRLAETVPLTIIGEFADKHYFISLISVNKT